MAFEIDMLACAAHEDELQREAEALQREEKRLAAVALLDARMGNIEKLWSAIDYGDNDAMVISALLQCAHDKHPAALSAIKKLADTYGKTNAEVKQ